MQAIELYVHIPFCIKKCAYCDFLSEPADKYFIRRTITSICREIEAYSSFFLKKIPVLSVYFGGGTPSSVESCLIRSILDTIRDNFNILPEAEVTIEVNPATFREDIFKSYMEMGINRLSIGLQSADEKELKILGRLHTFDDFIKTFAKAREAGFENISVDLMTGLPGQDTEGLKKTLANIVALRPEHISAYSLIIEEGTTISEDTSLLKNLPDEDSEREMYYFTRDFLAENGYKRYEISNFAREVDGNLMISRHNTGYWKGASYIGLGSGASSFYGDVRWSNVKNIKEYTEILSGEKVLSGQENVKPHQFLWVDKESVDKLSKKSKMAEFMFLGLRLADGVGISEFKEKFGEDIKEVYGEVINKYVEEKLLKISEGRVYLTDRGIDISNVVMADFL